MPAASYNGPPVIRCLASHAVTCPLPASDIVALDLLLLLLLLYFSRSSSLLSRLSTHSELQTLDADESMLHSIILILKRAINNQTWASINWQLPSPLNALALLTVNRHNVQAVWPLSRDCVCFLVPKGLC